MFLRSSMEHYTGKTHTPIFAVFTYKYMAISLADAPCRPLISELDSMETAVLIFSQPTVVHILASLYC